MGLFGTRNKVRDDAQVERIIAEIEAVQRDLAGIKGERKAHGEGKKLEDEIVRLKKDIADLEINKERLTEHHEREKRDVEHMVGLERKRQEFEVDAAKREVSISIREENLKADRERFEEQMQFMTDRMSEEVRYLRDIAEKLMQRLPNVEVNKTLEVIDGPTGTKRRRMAPDG